MTLFFGTRSGRRVGTGVATHSRIHSTLCRPRPGMQGLVAPNLVQNGIVGVDVGGAVLVIVGVFDGVRVVVGVRVIVGVAVLLGIVVGVLVGVGVGMMML